MTKIAALKTRLSWQILSIKQQAQQLSAKLNALDNQNHIYLQSISKADQPSAIFLPELEQSKRCFIAHQHQALERIAAQKNPLTTEHEALLSQKKYLNTRLRLLEKYSDKQAKQAYHHQQQTFEKSIDEWVLQGYLS